MNKNEGKFFSIEDLSGKISEKDLPQINEYVNWMFSDAKSFFRGSSVNIFKGISIYSSPEEDNVIAPTIFLNGKDAFTATGYISERPEQVASYEAVLNQGYLEEYNLSVNIPNKTLADVSDTMKNFCKKLEKKCFSQTIIIETENSVVVHITTEDASDFYNADILDPASEMGGIAE